MRTERSGRDGRYYIWGDVGYLNKEGTIISTATFWDTEGEAKEALDDYGVTEHVDSKFLDGGREKVTILNSPDTHEEFLGETFIWGDTPQGRDYWSRVYGTKPNKKAKRILTKMQKLAEAADKYPIGGKYVRTSHSPDFGKAVWTMGTEYELTNIKYSDLSKEDKTIYVSMGKDTTIESDNFHNYFELVIETLPEAVRPIKVGDIYQRISGNKEVIKVTRLSDNYVYSAAKSWSHDYFRSEFKTLMHTPSNELPQGAYDLFTEDWAETETQEVTEREKIKMTEEVNSDFITATMYPYDRDIMRAALNTHCLLVTAFEWRKTPQDEKYWSGIHTHGHTEESKRIIQKMIIIAEGTQMDEITEEVDITKLNTAQLGTLKEALLDSDHVASAFDWEDTPQGHNYWSDIDHKGHTDTSKRIIQKMINQQEAEMAGAEVTEDIDISVIDLEELDDLKKGLENHDVIHEAFCWCDTPQKHDYWSEIHETGHTDKSKRIVQTMITELEKTLPNQAKVAEQIVTKRQGIKKWLLG